MLSNIIYRAISDISQFSNKPCTTKIKKTWSIQIYLERNFRTYLKLYVPPVDLYKNSGPHEPHRTTEICAAKLVSNPLLHRLCTFPFLKHFSRDRLSLIDDNRGIERQKIMPQTAANFRTQVLGFSPFGMTVKRCQVEKLSLRSYQTLGETERRRVGVGDSEDGSRTVGGLGAAEQGGLDDSGTQRLGSGLPASGCRSCGVMSVDRKLCYRSQTHNRGVPN